MSCSGTVKSWRGKYGFAEATDGRLVYIHTSEIDGGRLRIGMDVNFDVEVVEGHGGRVKGSNVSGEAVLKKGERLSDEEMQAERARMKELRESHKEEQGKELAAVKDQVDKLSRGAKYQLAKHLMKELEIDVAPAEEETRPDPTEKGSKKQYTKAEFLKFYGEEMGPKIWALAKPKAAKKARK